VSALVNQEKRARAKAARDQRRKAIRNAAAHMFLHQPYAGVDLDAIGRTAGVKRGIVSLYFGNREELFLAIMKDEVTSWFTAVEARVEQLGERIDDDSLVRLFTDEIGGRKLLLRLTGLLQNVLEENVDILPAQMFLDVARKRSLSLGALLDKRCSGFREGDGVRFLLRFDIILAGLAQGTRLSGIFAALLEDDNMAPFHISFPEEFELLLRKILPAGQR